MGTGPKPGGPRVRVPIALKLIAFAGLLALLSALPLGLWLTNEAERTLTASSRDYRLAIAEDLAQTVAAQTDAARTALRASALLLTDPALSEEARVPLLLAQVGSEPSLDQVAIYDTRGELIDVVREPDAPRPVIEPELVSDLRAAAAADTGNPYVGEVTFAPEPRVWLYTALRPRGSRTTGYLAAPVRLDAVATRISDLDQKRLQAATARVYVADRRQNVVASNDAGDVGKSRMGDPLFRYMDVALVQQIAMSADVDRDDGPWLGSVVPLPQLNWAVVIEVPRAIAYAPIDAMHRTIWIAVLIALGVAGLAGFIGARRFARPLERLTRFAQALAARQFAERSGVRGHDEVGVLATVLDQAATDLRASEETIRREAAIRADLGRYLPRELVDRVVAREQDLGLGGARQPITVLFADVVRFTPMCEDLAPEQVVALLNELFTVVTEIVFRHGGTVDKFIGDGVMAFWGAPEACEDHADRALQAAEDMLRWLEVGNDAWEQKFGVKLELAIGINSGTPIVGNIGSSTRMEYTAIGEAVNVAARLEALARPNQVLTTAATRDAATRFEFTRVGEEVLTEGSDPVEVWEVRL